MGWLLLILLSGGLVAFKIWTRKYYNPYKLILIYGKKGCGKSTIAQKILYQHMKKGWKCYCNIGDSRMKGVTQVDAAHLWEREYREHSLIVIDEVNLLWDNRQFKTFPKDLAAWFRLQRHHKVKVVLFSQTADADKKIRDLTDRVYLCRRWFDVLIVCTPYEKEIVYREHKQEVMQSGFMDVYEKKNFGPLGCLFCWLPFWVKTHDSFQKVAVTDEEREAKLDEMHKKVQDKKQKKRPQQPAAQPDPRRSSRTGTRSDCA